ncbi:MAG: phosphatidate cytidylyltransferase [Betaproteobacteria bacterium]|nr:MAG: phosphatidate cytidylyltransferase [Betaproteobacteria bacterium]
MLKTRVLTALVLLVLFLAALFWLPPSGWAIFSGALILPAAWEWAQLIKYRKVACGLYVLFVAAICASLFEFGQGGRPAGPVGAPLVIYLCASLFWMIVVPLWLWRTWLPRSRWLAALTGLVVLVPAWLALLELRNLAPALLLLLLSVAWISDTAAYFAGHRFGRHKLAPAISPGKTWEGAAGAMLAVSAYAVLWSYAWPSYFPPALKSMHFGLIGMLPFLWLLAAVGIYGDLFESAVKRRAGAKDSGVLLPGHGGVLDRVDALTSVLPVAALVYLL